MAIRNKKWILQPAQLFGLATFGLLTLALGCIALGVAALVREVDFGYLLILGLTALAASWRLAGGTIPTWKSSLLLVFSGILIPLIWAGQLLGVLLAWLVTLPDLLWQSLQRNPNSPVNLTAYQTTWEALQLRLNTLLADLGLWLRSLLAGTPGFNYTAALLFWGSVIWLVAAWAGWVQRRREQPLAAILPGGVLLLSVMGYTYGSTTALIILLFAVLLLTAANHYARKERSWKEGGMDFPEARRGEIFSRFVALSFGFVLAAALIPRISITHIIQQVQAWASPRIRQVDSFAKSFGLEAEPVLTETLERASAGGLPRQHLIGAGPELSAQVVMQVQVRGMAAETDPLILPLYWRALTYDRYTGRGWKTSDLEVASYAADEAAQPPMPQSYATLQQDFRRITGEDFIYAAGEILALDQNYQLAWRTIPESAVPQALHGDLFAGTVEGHAYRVISQIPAVSEAELQSASGLYPDWIRARYLALPVAPPPRVTALARELTRDAPTPYDKARAIETYLRSYKFELNLPAPPQNRDLVDTFLFELQKGYCDYYASAMVVLARSVGLPARLAVGYARGTYDPGEQIFTVTEENAHTWAEIYFTGIGWVPFEPTAAQPEIERRAQGKETPPVLESTPKFHLRDWLDGWNLTLWLIGFLGIFPGAALLLGFGFLGDVVYLRCLPPSRLAITLFRRLYRCGPRLGIPVRAGETPYEFANLLEQQFISIHPIKFEPIPAMLQSLSRQYVSAAFSPRPLTGAEKKQLLRLWSKLRGKLLLAGWYYFWQKERIRVE